MVFTYKENMKKNISTEHERMVNRWNTKKWKNQRRTDGWSRTEYDYGQIEDDTGDRDMWRNLL